MKNMKKYVTSHFIPKIWICAQNENSKIFLKQSQNETSEMQLNYFLTCYEFNCISGGRLPKHYSEHYACNFKCSPLDYKHSELYDQKFSIVIILSYILW